MAFKTYGIKARRKLWLQVHLWLGLAAGLVLSIAGITGSILVFHHEINEYLFPELLHVMDRGGETEYRNIGALESVATSLLPAGSTLRGARYPRRNDVAFALNYTVPATSGLGFDRIRVFVDPYTGKPTGRQLMKAADSSLPSTFIGFVFELHYALLAGQTGKTVLGILSIGMLFSILTGLILWWPLDGKWRRVLALKRGAGPIRLNYDLHQLHGVYFFPVLAALLLSGIYLVLPTQFMAALHFFSPDAVRRYAVQSVQPLRGSGIGLETAVQSVRNQFPDGRPSWLYIPNQMRTSYMICQEGASTPSRFIDRRCSVVDAFSGEILHVEEAGTRTAGDTFIAWQWPLHSGQAFGWPGRILVFLCGLACPIIFVTGVIRWLQKRRARAKQSARLAAQTS